MNELRKAAKAAALRDAARYVVTVHDLNGKFVGFSRTLTRLSIDRQLAWRMRYDFAADLAKYITKKFPGWIGTAIPEHHEVKAPIQCR